MQYIGIDIGGTNTKIGFFNNNLELFKKIIIDTQKYSEELLLEIAKIVNENNINNEYEGIGITVPGFIKKDGFISEMPNINIKDININQIMKEYTNLNTIGINDGNAAAIAEIYNSKLNKNNNYLIITIGTGLGGAIVINNKVILGNRGMSSEIGHLKIDEKYNFLCGCGKRGCAETIVSLKGIKNLINYYQKEYPYSKLNCDNINGFLYYNALSENDALANKIMEIQSHYLSKLIDNVNTIIDLDQVIVGGGLANKTMLNNTIANYLKISLVQYHNLEIRLTKNKNDSGMIGAVYNYIENN
ncbi:ROK family protein [Mycoplasma sp. P36-A1]|uniref:ROK family protein n=1 Tax=Mycoplasma sp. P36-A1 TaxID=3252900 RepID=UPI003C2F3C71